MAEYLDILDSFGRQTGEVIEYNEAHAKGLIHRGVHVWIMNGKKELLLQKRSTKKSAYPDLWDISVGGHVSSGETSEDGAIREAEEEIGMDLKLSELKKIFTVEENFVLNNGTYISHEFDDVYLVVRDFEVADLKIEKDEIREVRWLSVSELKSLLRTEPETFVPHEEYQKLFEYLDTIETHEGGDPEVL